MDRKRPFLWASLACLTSAGGALLWAECAKQQLFALANARIVEGGDLDKIEEAFLLSPEKRIYVKGSGRITTDSPLQIQTDGDETMLVVHKTEHVTDVYQSVISRQVLVSKEQSAADNIHIKVSVNDGKEEAPNSMLYVSPSLVGQIDPALAVTKTQITGPRWISIIFSMVGIRWSWKRLTTISVVRDNTHVFFAGDIAYNGGKLRLVKSNGNGPAILSTQSEQSLLESLGTRVWNIELVSLGACIAALVLYGIDAGQSK